MGSARIERLPRARAKFHLSRTAGHGLPFGEQFGDRVGDIGRAFVVEATFLYRGQHLGFLGRIGQIEVLQRLDGRVAESFGGLEVIRADRERLVTA